MSKNFNMTTPGTSGGSASVQEFKIRVPKNVKKNYHVMRFNATLNVDFAKWTHVKMERENNIKEFKGMDEDMPKFGAGSEYGRDMREEARRKKFGITSRKYKPEDQPWILKVGGKTGKKFKGIREGGVSENTAFYVFTHAADGAIDAYPLQEWYNFQPIQRYKALSAEEAEQEFGRFNELNGRPRQLNQLKIQWKSMKISARKDMSMFKKECNKTGGGGRPDTPTNDVLEIRDLLNPAELLRDSNIYDDDGIKMYTEHMEVADRNSDCVKFSTSVAQVAQDVKNETMKDYAIPIQISQEDVVIIDTPIKKTKPTPLRNVFSQKSMLKKSAKTSFGTNKGHNEYLISMAKHSRMLKDDEHLRRMETVNEEHVRRMEMAEEEHKIKMETHSEKLKCAILEREILELKKKECLEKLGEIRNKVLNYFSLMLRKRMRGDDGADEVEDPDEKKLKGAKAKKDLKISDMDEWIDSDDDSSNSEKEEKDNESDSGTNKKKKDKKGAAKNKKKKKKVEDEAFEESDDGDEEGRERDYISDSSDSESDHESKANKELKGVAEEDALRKLLTSDEDSEDSEKEHKEQEPDQEEEPTKEGEERASKLTKKKKKQDDSKKPESSSEFSSDSDTDPESSSTKKPKKNKSPPEKNGPSNSASGSANTSRSGTPTPSAAAAAVAAANAANSREPPSKRPKLESAYTECGVTEEAVRRYLARKPMTTTELLTKFKSKRTGVSSDRLVETMTQILKRINPDKRNINGKMYLSIKNT